MVRSFMVAHALPPPVAPPVSSICGAACWHCVRCPALLALRFPSAKGSSLCATAPLFPAFRDRLWRALPDPPLAIADVPIPSATIRRRGQTVETDAQAHRVIRAQVETRSDMIDRAGKFQSQLARHQRRIRSGPFLVKLNESLSTV